MVSQLTANRKPDQEQHRKPHPPLPLVVFLRKYPLPLESF
jgi:hypothetical protein